MTRFHKQKTIEAAVAGAGTEPSVGSIINAMHSRPLQVRFPDLRRVCEHYFGEARAAQSSCLLFTTPWPGDPHISIRDCRGKAQAAQVRQVLSAIEQVEQNRLSRTLANMSIAIGPTPT